VLIRRWAVLGVAASGGLRLDGGCGVEGGSSSFGRCVGRKIGRNDGSSRLVVVLLCCDVIGGGGGLHKN
jgi:hypothetical protein